MDNGLEIIYAEQMQNFVWMMFAMVCIGGALIFWSRTKKKPKEETPFLLLQQQMDALRLEIRSQSQNQLELLQKSQQGIGQRLDNAAKLFGGMESKMAKVEETTKQVLEVGKDIADLQQILKAPKLRGNFGEQLLGDLLAQMMPPENFVLQHTFESGERVDAVIKTAQHLVPIDAKFPLENFRRTIEAKTDDEKLSNRKLFLIDVKKHINDIAQKYILPAEGTFEFALMYIPAENVYYEIIADLDYAAKKHVIPVSPSTFYAYLQTILLGLRGLQVQKRVKEILLEMGRVRKEVGSFKDDFGKLGKHLNDAVSSFGKSEKRLIRLEDKMASLDAAPSEVVIERSEEEQPLLEQ